MFVAVTPQAMHTYFHTGLCYSMFTITPKQQFQNPALCSSLKKPRFLDDQYKQNWWFQIKYTSNILIHLNVLE